jgi:hypothetical protein
MEAAAWGGDEDTPKKVLKARDEGAGTWLGRGLLVEIAPPREHAVVGT